MPKKTHKLRAVSVTQETYDKIKKAAKDRRMFDYEIVEEKFKR